MKPVVVVRIAYPSSGLEMLQPDFTVHYAPTAEEFDKAIRDVGQDVQAVVTKGSIGLTAEQMCAMPKLGIVLNRGAGHEKVDMAAAATRGIVVTDGRGLNAFTVADHALALMLSAARHIVSRNEAVRAGKWVEAALLPAPAVVFEKRLGIVGLGAIGKGIARRASGFSMTIGYNGRARQADQPYTYYANPRELAAASDYLVVSVPGGDGTRGIITADTLEALGPKGFFINVGRGTVVDNDALADALYDQKIAGAAIDVVATEPAVPERLMKAPNLVITPHIGGASVEARQLASQHVTNNLKAFFGGGKIIDIVTA